MSTDSGAAADATTSAALDTGSTALRRPGRTFVYAVPVVEDGGNGVTTSAGGKGSTGETVGATRVTGRPIEVVVATTAIATRCSLQNQRSSTTGAAVDISSTSPTSREVTSTGGGVQLGRAIGAGLSAGVGGRHEVGTGTACTVRGRPRTGTTVGTATGTSPSVIVGVGARDRSTVGVAGVSAQVVVVQA